MSQGLYMCHLVYANKIAILYHYSHSSDEKAASRGYLTGPLCGWAEPYGLSWWGEPPVHKPLLQARAVLKVCLQLVLLDLGALHSADAQALHPGILLKMARVGALVMGSTALSGLKIIGSVFANFENPQATCKCSNPRADGVFLISLRTVAVWHRELITLCSSCSPAGRPSKVS